MFTKWLARVLEYSQSEKFFEKDSYYFFGSSSVRRETNNKHSILQKLEYPSFSTAPINSGFVTAARAK